MLPLCLSAPTSEIDGGESVIHQMAEYICSRAAVDMLGRSRKKSQMKISSGHVEQRDRGKFDSLLSISSG